MPPSQSTPCTPFVPSPTPSPHILSTHPLIEPTCSIHASFSILLCLSLCTFSVPSPTPSPSVHAAFNCPYTIFLVLLSPILFSYIFAQTCAIPLLPSLSIPRFSPISHPVQFLLPRSPQLPNLQLPNSHPQSTHSCLPLFFFFFFTFTARPLDALTKPPELSLSRTMCGGECQERLYQPSSMLPRP